MKMPIITPAAWTLVGSVAVSWEKAKNPLVGAVPNQAKAFFPRIPLETTTKQHPLKGFFTSIAAASAASYSSLESAGCTVKTGWSVSPLTASLVALVERLHNLSAQSGKMVWQWMNQPVMRTWSGNRWSSGQEHFLLLPL